MFVVLLSQFSLLDFLESSPFDCFVLFCFVLFLLPFLSHFFLIAWFGLKASLYYQPFSLISVVLCTIPLLLSSLAFSRTPIIPLDTYVTSVSDSPQRSRKKSVWFWYWYPFTLYPLHSTLYPPPAFDASNDDNGHYTYTLYRFRASFFLRSVYNLHTSSGFFGFGFFGSRKQTDSDLALLLFSFYTNCVVYIHKVKSSILNFEHEHEWVYTDSHYTLHATHSYSSSEQVFFLMFGTCSGLRMHTNIRTRMYTQHTDVLCFSSFYTSCCFFSLIFFFFFFFLKKFGF